MNSKPKDAARTGTAHPMRRASVHVPEQVSRRASERRDGGGGIAGGVLC